MAESRLWKLLRKRRIDGFLFRRQFPVGAFFADFFCPAARLAIEVDGASHAFRETIDLQRDQCFALRGIKVLRLSNELVMEQPLAAVARIRAALRESEVPGQS